MKPPRLSRNIDANSSRARWDQPTVQVDVVFTEARRRAETCFYDGGDDGRMWPVARDGRSSYVHAQHEPYASQAG